MPIVIFLTDLNKNSGFFDISVSRACAFSTSRSKSYLYLPCIYDNVEIGCKYILNVITNYPCFEQWSFERMEYRGPLYRLSFCISTTYSKSVTTYGKKFSGKVLRWIYFLRWNAERVIVFLLPLTPFILKSRWYASQNLKGVKI